MLTASELTAKYGKPGDPSKITSIILPYPMRIAWLPTQTVSKIQCNKGIAPNLLKCFEELLQAYSLPEIKRLGIDLFGGCVNVRPKRGLEAKYTAAMKADNTVLAESYLSRHAWGCAIDLDPARNGLKVKKPVAQFSKPEYKFMVDTFHKHGFIGYGPERNYDAMHWEIGS